jgi:hypothetical protein
MSMTALLAGNAPTRVKAEIYKRLKELGIAADRPTKRGTKGFGRGAIPVWISGSPGHSANPTVNKARGSNPCNLISIPRAPRQTSHLRQFTIGLLNARSAKQND